MQKKKEIEPITSNTQDFDHQLIENRYIRLFITVVVLGIYFALNIQKVHLSKLHSESIKILNKEVRSSAIVAMISQIQIIITVFLVVLQRRAGYIIDWIITGISLGLSLSGVFVAKENVALQGIFPQILTMLVIIVIYKYIQLSEKKYNEMLEQREEILALYEEIAESENTLIDQKDQLEIINEKLKERETELNELAFFDPLTTLPNRRMILEKIDSLITSRELNETVFSVIFIDLDNFKKINDSAGHMTGDEVLCEIANRWNKKIHKDDVLGRLGGDEFAIIIQRPLSHEEIRDYVTCFRESLDEPVQYKHREFYLKASFGISMYPDDGNNSESLLKYADVAMYEAKASKMEKIQFFNQTLQENFQHGVLLEHHLQQVLVRNELYLMFQPQYEGLTNKLRGFEALARWNSKELGFVSPAEFIPIAEENGMIISMGEWILRESCKICKQWMDICQKKFRLSVNVSVIQLLDPNFSDMVDRVLLETEFDPEYLEVEVTESMFISSMEAAILALEKLQEKKITVALDDFGTGYASLSYLQSLPINVIKIDKSFIDNVLVEKKQEALVKSIIGVSHEFDLKVIAEGVEEHAQLDLLKQVQCDYIQGYLLGKPLDKENAFSVINNSII